MTGSKSDDVDIDKPNCNDEDDPVYDCHHFPITIGYDTPKKSSKKGSVLRFKYLTPSQMGSSEKHKVADFAKLIAGKFPGRQPLVETPLDIRVGTPCHIIFELDPTWNWSFRCDTGAITTKGGVEHRYVNLQYYNSKGEHIPSPKKNQDCKMVSITAVPRAVREQIDHFNIKLRFTMMEAGKKKTLDVTFDPDINNSGGNGFTVT
jgi:hypothetical protein